MTTVGVVTSRSVAVATAGAGSCAATLTELTAAEGVRDTGGCYSWDRAGGESRETRGDTAGDTSGGETTETAGSRGSVGNGVLVTTEARGTSAAGGRTGGPGTTAAAGTGRPSAGGAERSGEGGREATLLGNDSTDEGSEDERVLHFQRFDENRKKKEFVEGGAKKILLIVSVGLRDDVNERFQQAE